MLAPYVELCDLQPTVPKRAPAHAMFAAGAGVLGAWRRMLRHFAQPPGTCSQYLQLVHAVVVH